MHALIDADIIVYRVGFACQRKFYDVFVHGEEKHGPVARFDYKKEAQEKYNPNEGEYIHETVHVDTLENCLHSVKLVINSILEELQPDSYTLFLTGKGNFRDKLVDYYKKNRKPEDKPFYYDEIRKYLINVWHAEVIEGMEADDALGAEQYGAMPGTTIICSIDKDLDMIPGWHYNFVTTERYKIEETEALHNFYKQLLSGDSTDNIPGMYKITGTKAAAKYKKQVEQWSEEQSMWEQVLDIYKDQFRPWIDDEAGGDITAALWDKLTEIGRLLWIKRDYDEPLWEPPQ